MSSKNFKFICKKGKNKNLPITDHPIAEPDLKPLPRIRVCVRKRPPNRKEIQNCAIDILDIKNGNSLTVKEPK